LAVRFFDTGPGEGKGGRRRRGRERRDSRHDKKVNMEVTVEKVTVKKGSKMTRSNPSIRFSLSPLTWLLSPLSSLSLSLSLYLR
jgi:hypothetical protein